MKDKNKTREEVIKELQQLRQRITELEALKTEYKLVDALQESHKNLQMLFDSLEDCLFVLDMEGCILSVNHVVLRRLGYSEAELLGEKVFKVHPPDRQEEAAAVIADMVAGKTNSCLVPLMSKDGTQIAVETKITRSRWGNQDVFFCVSRDISERTQVENALKDSEKRFRDLYENAPNAYFSVGTDGLIRKSNKRAEELLGYSTQELVGKPVFKLYADTPQGKGKASKIFEKFLAGGTITDEELQMQKKDGTPVWVSLTVNTVRNGTGQIIESRSMVVDITKRKRTEEALQSSEEKYRAIFEGAKDAIYITTREGILLDANQSLLALFGYTSEDLEGLDINKTYLDPASRLRFQKEIEKTGSVRDYEMKLRKKDGTEIDCLISATVRRDSGGNIIGYQGIIHDITDYKKTEEELAYMATHDVLTGLPNRMLFNDRLTLALAQALRNQKKLAVMLLDLDHFKDINDTLGHNGGDQLLCEVSNRLIGLLRKSDTIARMGGDEFLLLLQEIAQERYAINIARKLVNAFRKPFVIADHKLHITTSVGIAIYPDDGEDIDTLLGNADIAMYNVKQKGRNAYQRYTLTMKNKDRRITGIK